ncbi:RHS repeat domain-containing protein [Tenacibaculum maritimum]|uniref:RHS repeat domain-containing protein n=2 Tax=Tenacibaculum maritimum TaxID=107401 RepID=UPI00352B6E34
MTWVYESGRFVPSAKLVGGERYSILSDYLGTPIQAYDARGNIVWECELDIYGKVRNLHGEKTFIPFRYQGQYEDIETGLYYNRFRYYSPDTGIYISQDPIGLHGGFKPYEYSEDTNILIDPFGLITIANLDGVKIIAYPGPEATDLRPEHKPYHVHVEEAGNKTRVLMEDYETGGKKHKVGDVFPDDPSMTKKMKKVLKKLNLSDLAEKAKNVFHKGCA